jgi:uncharacterized protein YjiK
MQRIGWISKLKVYGLGVVLLLAIDTNTQARMPVSPAIFDGHTLSVSPVDLVDVGYDASGIAWSGFTESLFVVRNDDPMIFELDAKANVIRNIELHGFYDVEGIAWLSENIFAVVEERTCSVWLIDINGNTTSITKPKTPFFTMPDLNKSFGNSGCEDVAWDAKKNTLYLIKEKSPAVLLSVTGLDIHSEQQGALTVQVMYSSSGMGILGSDISGLHFDVGNGQLLVLSDESKAITGINMNPTVIATSAFELGWFNNGLLAGIPQPEGVTMDTAGNLYVLSEPNQLYRFSR